MKKRSNNWKQRCFSQGSQKTFQETTETKLIPKIALSEATALQPPPPPHLATVLGIKLLAGCPLVGVVGVGGVDGLGTGLVEDVGALVLLAQPVHHQVHQQDRRQQADHCAADQC